VVKFVGLTPFRFTEGALVVIQPGGLVTAVRLVMGSYHAGAAFTERADKRATASRGRTFLFIDSSVWFGALNRCFSPGGAAVRLFRTFQYSKSGNPKSKSKSNKICDTRVTDV